MYKKKYYIQYLEEEDAGLINSIILKPRNGFYIWPQCKGIADDGDYMDSMVFKFGDANGSSENLTKEINDALLEEVKNEFREIKEYYEITEYS